jgi:hypothetical protein
MRQDSYDPVSSKEIITFHQSERMLKPPIAAIPELRNGPQSFMDSDAKHDDFNDHMVLL